MAGFLRIADIRIGSEELAEAVRLELNQHLATITQVVNHNADTEELRWFYSVPAAGTYVALVAHYPRRIRAIRTATINNTCDIRVGWSAGAGAGLTYLGWKAGTGAGNAIKATSSTVVYDTSTTNYDLPEANILAIEVSNVGGGLPALSGLAVTLLTG